MTLVLQDSMKGSWLVLMLVIGVEGQEQMMVVDFTQLIVNTTFNGTFDQDRIRGKQHASLAKLVEFPSCIEAQ